jgi:L-xylulokinase
MPSRILALDAGSSSIKAVLFDETGRPLCEAGAAVPLLRKTHGVVERDLGSVWKAFCRALADMRDRSPRRFDRIDVVSVTGAGDGLILLDGEGSLVRPAITSLDTRASGIVSRFKRSLGAKDLYALIGEIPYPATPLALLKWIKLNEPSSYAGGRKILFLKDWVRYRLTAELFTDISDASATLTDFDGSYSKEVFAAFGVPESLAKTIQIKASHEQAGRVTRRAAGLTGLKAGTPVICGLHDCSASSLGTARTRAGDTCMILGSWSGNQIVTDRPILNRRHPDHQILRNYAIPGKWLIISASPTSLVNLDWFISTFIGRAWAKGGGEHSVHARVDALANSVRSDEHLIFHPYLYGSQTSEQASAGFYGIRPWHGLPHFLRSIYEGIAINYSIHEDYLQESLPITRVSACGGGTRSKVLVQALADATGRKVRIYSSRQTTAVGAAITAAVGIGIYASYAEACRAMTSVQAVVAPRKNEALAMKRKRASFEKLYRQMMPHWQKMRD